MRAAVILSGCGYLDGAEITESVLSLLYLDQNQVGVEVFAPDKNQHHVVSHQSQEEVSETRNILAESARIARGKVSALSDLKAEKFDFLVLPGGFGVAKNLSDLAFKGEQASVDAVFAKIIQQFYQAKKPIAAICIAPAVVALVLNNRHISLTVGQDGDVAQLIQNSGNLHVVCAPDEACIDNENRVVSCSAYMNEDPLAAIAEGIEKAISHAVKMARQSSQSSAA